MLEEDKELTLQPKATNKTNSSRPTKVVGRGAKNREDQPFAICEDQIDDEPQIASNIDSVVVKASMASKIED